MAGSPDAPDDAGAPRRDAVFYLAVGAVGFFFLAGVSLFLSFPFHRNIAGYELLAAGVVALAVGAFLIVALVAVWLRKSWFGQIHD